MSTGNRISEVIPQTVKDAVKTKQHEMDVQMTPYYVDLSVVDKGHLSKVSDGTLPFIEKGAQFVITDPVYLAPYQDAAELAKDAKLFADAQAMLIPAKQFVAQLERIGTLAGSDTYAVLRTYYSTVQRAAKGGDARAQVIYDELKKRFDSIAEGRKKAEDNQKIV